MSELKKTMVKIEEMREQLHEMIHKGAVLQDEEIMEISRKLDVLLNEYYVLLREKEGKG